MKPAMRELLDTLVTDSPDALSDMLAGIDLVYLFDWLDSHIRIIELDRR